MTANVDDTLHWVKEAAGADAEVVPWRETSLPNIELFRLVSGIASGKPDRHDIAVIGGRLPWLEGTKAMDAVVASGISDAHALASAACFLLLDRSRLLETPEARQRPLTPAQQAVITPPVKTGNLLEFWCFAGVAEGTLKVRVDLATWRHMTVPLDIVVQARQESSERTRRRPADSSEARIEADVDESDVEPEDSRSVAMLIRILRESAMASSRALTARKLSITNHASAVAALTEALVRDTDVGVRKAVIAALVTVADPAVRPALEKAARHDPDADVRSYADWLLGMLARP